MKKTIILIPLMLISIVSWSQVSYGVRAGMSLSAYDLPYSNYLFKPSFNVGAIADIPIASSKFSFVPGLYFADKGSKDKGLYLADYISQDHFYYNSTLSDYQLELPLLFTYKILINKNITLKPQLGLFVSYSIYSKFEETRDYIKIVEESHDYVSYSYVSASYYVYNFGANAGISVFYNKFSFTYSCDFGYSSSMRPSKYFEIGGYYPDICMYFTLGYNF